MIRVKNGKIVEIVPAGEKLPDGEYCSMTEYAVLHGVTSQLVRMWKKRGMLETIDVDGRTYVNTKIPIKWRQKSKIGT